MQSLFLKINGLNKISTVRKKASVSSIEKIKYINYESARNFTGKSNLGFVSNKMKNKIA